MAQTLPFTFGSVPSDTEHGRQFGNVITLIQILIFKCNEQIFHFRYPRKEAMRPEGKRYVFYSLYSWGSAACVTGLAIVVHFFIEDESHGTTSPHSFFTWYRIGKLNNERNFTRISHFHKEIVFYRVVGISSILLNFRLPFPGQYLRVLCHSLYSQ